MHPRITGTAALAFSLLCAAAAHAGLGGDATQVLADAAVLQGTAKTAPGPVYDILEIAGTAGAQVREYMNRDGRVFAVSWAGPVVPDLRQLLAAHYDSYARAVAAIDHSRIRRSVRIVAGELVVESGGHMRAYTGRAYLSALIPAGVPLAELR